MYQLQNSRFGMNLDTYWTLMSKVEPAAFTFSLMNPAVAIVIVLLFSGKPFAQNRFADRGQSIWPQITHTHIPGKCLIRTWARPLMTCAVKPDWLNDFFSMHQNLPVNEPVLTHERQPISRCTNTKDIQTHVKRIEGKKLRQKRHSSGPFNEPTVEPKIWLTHFFPVSECWLQGMQCYSDSIKNCVGPYQGTAKTRSCDRPITDSGWGVRNPSVVLEFLGFLRLMSSSVDSMSLFLHENIFPHAITLAVSLSHKDWFPWLSDYESKTTYDYYRDQYHHHHDYYYYYYY